AGSDGSTDRFASPSRWARTYPHHVVSVLAPLGDVRRDVILGVGAAALVILAHQADSTFERSILEGDRFGNGWDTFGSDWGPRILVAGYLVPAVGGALVG